MTTEEGSGRGEVGNQERLRSWRPRTQLNHLQNVAPDSFEAIHTGYRGKGPGKRGSPCELYTTQEFCSNISSTKPTGGL